ncbi:MAG: FlgD immunoglobulin-like domain containing protein, partial [Candidatus Zixiibacteriota bacterium]
PEVLGTNYVRFVTQATTGGLNLTFNGADSANWKTSVIGYSSADPDYFAEFTLDSLKSGNFKFHNWNNYDDIIMIPTVITKTTGAFNYSYSATYDSTLTEVEEIPDLLPHSFTLSQNYPNPFNPSTTIPFQVYGSQFIVHSPIHTTLKIYNIRGQLVRTLVDEEKLQGDYNVIWDGKDNSGKDVTSGIYFYQLKTDNATTTKKMVLLR